MDMSRKRKAPAPTTAASEDRDNVSVVARVMAVLGAVARSGGELSVAQLADRIGLPKPTVHRLCQQLEAEGYLLRDPDSRHYTVGSRLWTLGLDVVNSGSRPERRAVLQKLVDQIGETCNLSMRVHDRSVYVDRVESRWPLRLHLDSGSQVPLHCTASGKLFLSDMSRARRQKLLSVAGLAAHTPHTIASLDRMEEEVELIRKQGYSIDNEEFLQGLVALAVPVRNKQGRIVAGIACHGPTLRLSIDKVLLHLPALQEAASSLEAMLSDGDENRSD